MFNISEPCNDSGDDTTSVFGLIFVSIWLPHLAVFGAESVSCNHAEHLT